MKLKNVFSLLFGGRPAKKQTDTEGKPGSIPEDIRSKVWEIFPNEADRSYVLQKLGTLWQIPLNVGPAQLARGILVLSGGNREEFDALFDGDFMGDPRDLLVSAEKNLGNPGHFGSPPFEPAPNRLERQVADLIADGKIPEAMQVLLDAGHTDAALLKTQWDTLMHRQQTDEKLDWENFTITQNRITFALLEMARPSEAHTLHETIPEIETPKSEPFQSEYPKLTEKQCTQLLHLLQQDQWREALVTGKNWSAEIMLLHGRTQHVERQYHLGLVLEATYGTELEQIKQALAYLLQNKDA